MLETVSYKENPEHYKRLIQKINEECNFPSYLTQSGYVLLKKSAGSMEFQKDSDRIVLIISANPVYYFNRSDSEDKGRFFSFILKREQGKAKFFLAIEEGLKAINSLASLEVNYAQKKTKPNKSLEENYNIVPLTKPIYLVKERMISIETINSEFFKGRIFNAFHYRDNNSRIANIAFPKYDLAGNIKNYILYNRPYRDKATGKLKGFKLVLNQKDQYLWYSNIPKNGIKRIVFGECGIDLISFNELNGIEGDFYVSFGGNIYKEKLDFFMELITPFISNTNIELVSILDNDLTGHEFDLKVFTRVINETNPKIYLENYLKNGAISIKIHYDNSIRNLLESDSKRIDSYFKTGLLNDGMVKNTVFLDKLLLETELPQLMKIKYGSYHNTNAFNALLLTLNKIYLPNETKILKSVSKDWNQDLKNSKKKAYSWN